MEQQRETLALWIEQYNPDYPYPSMDYRTPEEYRADYLTMDKTKLFCS